MAEMVDLQEMLNAIQAEMVAQREILAFLTYGLSGMMGVDINEMSDRIHALAQAGEHPAVNERVEFFANWIVGPERPKFTIIDGGKDS